MFFNGLRLLGLFVIALFLMILIFLIQSSGLAFSTFGLNFILSKEWNPPDEIFAVLAFAYGTVVSSALALLMALPISIGAAIFLTELCPNTLRRPLRFLIEMLAAIPSVVYGLWGIFVMAPFIRSSIQPFLAESFPWLGLFQGPPYGVGLFSAGLILAIMIIPTITSISTEVFDSIPNLYREGAKALGATEWETIKTAVLGPGMSGVVAAAILGLGRAVGETMAVTMVIGNRSDISASLFSPSATMASVIANEYADANGDLHISALLGVGLCLLILSLVINSISRIVIWKVRRNSI